MRKVREITAEEERFRLEDAGDNMRVVRRDPVQPEPIGTLLLVPVRIVGYDPDCDGSLMARYEFIGLDDVREDPDPEILALPLKDCRSYGISTNHGLYPTSGFVLTPDEVERLAAGED